jgi:glutamine amidotransferase
LYFSTKVDTLRALHPDAAFLRDISDETRLVASEPLGALPGAWNEVPESSYGIIEPRGRRASSFPAHPAGRAGPGLTGEPVTADRTFGA